ncbi:unnamed protein product [Linum trigynum]|uniref:KIB1-4 beta-propeller domain-containing protein n=1 Tax=Linum trigynum TaxID=586398 RepID=A0AAV2D137_9ROSI
MMRKEEFRVGGTEQGHGWSELPGELLTLIEQRYLIQLKHAIRFRAVCKPWRKTLAELQPLMFRQSFSSPLLMLPYCNDDDHQNEGCGSQELQCRRLLDLSHGQYHHIDFVQGFEKTNCRGSGFGWLFMLQLPAPVLLNPLTGKQISLPPFTSLPDVLQYNPERVGGEFVLQHPDGDRVRVGNRRLGLNFLRVVAMSADPTTSEEDSSCTLMAIRTNEGRDLVYCKPGGDRWTLIPDPERISASCNSIVFWRNRFHVVDCHGNVLRCDIDNPAAPTISCLVAAGVSVASPFTYLVVGPDDELIMVIKSVRYEFDDEDAPPAAEGGYGSSGHHHEDAGHHEDVGHHEAAYHNEDVGGGDDHHGDVGHHEAAYHNEDVGDDDDHPEDVVGDHDDDQDSILDFTDGELDGEADLESYWSQDFMVCRLNEDTYHWDRVQSLGDFAFFLGSNASSCVSTRDYPGLKSNCIYFTDDYIAKHVPGRLGGHDMGIFHLSDGTVEPFCCNGLYKPSLIWSPPVWILP